MYIKGILETHLKDVIENRNAGWSKLFGRKGEKPKTLSDLHSGLDTRQRSRTNTKSTSSVGSNLLDIKTYFFS